MRRAFATILFAGLMVFAMVASADAAVMVSPSKIRLDVSPGMETSFVVTLSNTDATSLQLTTSTWDFARDAQGQPQRVALVDEARFRGCASWMTMSDTPTSAPAGSDAVVPVTVRVPADAVWGSHYAYLQLGATPALPKRGVVVAYAINVLVVLTVAPPEGSASAVGAAPVLSRSVSVAQLATPSMSVETSVPLTAVLSNTGNVSADMRTRFDILENGRVVDSVRLKDFTLLPGDTFPLSAIWSDAPLLGRYTVRFVAAVSEGPTLVKETVVWVVSKIAILIAAAGILILIVAVLLFRRYVHVEFRPTGLRPATE